MKAVFSLTILVLLTTCTAHSHLAKPLPTRRLDCRAGNGRPRQCYGPCPPLDTYGEPTGVSPQRPAETWRRGERRSVSWHRNNHGKGESGFVRLSLVPVNQMMNHKAHQKYTFQISCWASGLHRCHSRSAHVCGNDKEGKAYKVPIKVPTSYPDGVYALGWAWFGAGDFSGKSFFGDYYSCSFIHIKGGAAVTPSFKPSFTPGLNQAKSSCMSATPRPGVCRREPCRAGRVKPMRPSQLPRFINSRDFQGRSPKPGNTAQPNRRPNRPAPTGQKKPNRGNKPIKIRFLKVYDVSSKRSRRAGGNRFNVKLSSYKKGFTLGLEVSGSNISKVVFNYAGKWRTEKKIPYIVNGDDNGRLKGLGCRKGQTIRIKCAVFSRDGKRVEKTFQMKCI